MKQNYPKIGIRPIIDGRRGGIRESLEETTMNLAKSVEVLYKEQLRYPDGSPVECVIADSCIGGVKEAAMCAAKFEKEHVGLSLSVTPCWCYGSETMDMNPLITKAVWGFNGTERPGAVYLAAVLAAHNQKGLPAFGIYGRHVQDIGDSVIPEDVEALDEVVVVGFGTQKKASVVGSITNVDPGKLSLTPSRSLSNNLAGMVSGVIGVQWSGNPWFNNSDFWIRGISTFTGNANPMVLMDGIERSIHDIDPEEIESFSVLKDAAASAVYGVRGANGVIMINTKRGKIGKPQVDVRFEKAFTSPIKLLDYVGSVKYLELMNEMSIDNGQAPLYSEATILNYKYQTDPELYPDVNWWNVVAKNQADNTKANISINGGSDILRYSLVLGYYDENGIIRRDPNQEWDSSLKVSRYNVRSNVDVNVTPTTLLRVNLGGFLQTKNAPQGNEETDFGIFYQAMRIPPYMHPPIYADGRIPRVFAKENPWAWATQRGFEKINHSKIEALTAIEQDLKFITPGLRAKLSFAFDKYSGNTVTRSKTPDYYNPASARDANGNIVTTISHHGEQFLGHSRGADWGDQSIYLEGMVSYNRIFNDIHDVNSMLLYNQKDYDRGDALPYRNQGIAGRFSYTYDRRYVGEINFGYNGSENFAPGKRFGFFPAMALGWIISQEQFMEPVSNTISNLKIRGSVGQAGNSILGRNIWDKRFAYISTIVDTGSYRWGTDNNIYRLGRAEGEIGVPNLTWETVTKANVGFELGLWNNGVSLIADFFKEKREDIFMERTNVQGTAGFNRNIWANFGKVNNQGVELSLNINKQINNDWFVSALVNYTYAHNEVVEIDEPSSIVGTYRSQTGKPVGQLFGLISDGLFTENDFDENGILKEDIPVQNFSDMNNLRPGDIKYRDMNGDGVITALDGTAIGGTRIPEIIYGFGANLKYKMLDFGFFFQGAGKTYQILEGESWLPGSVLGAGNIFSNIDDRWTPENPSQEVFWPRLGNMAVANNEVPSTWWLRDMSFLRLKSIELGYSFSREWVNKIGVRDCRLFVRGSNLVTFSKFKLWDPELETSDGLKYPQMKSVSVGAVYPDNNDWGRATSIMASAIRARTLLFAASPLFNGNPDLKDWKNGDGVSLFKPDYDESKWVKTAAAHKELIDAAHAAGYALYKEYNKDDSIDPFMSYYNMYCNREPRFYVSVIFNEAWLGVDNRRVEFLQGGGRDTGPTFDAPQNGYNVRKRISLEVFPRENRHPYQPGILYRLAEAYLGYAEALNESQGPTAEAYEYINLVRERAGIPDLQAGLNKKQMREAIQQERRVEFNGEGIRFNDVRRWKQGEKYLNTSLYGMNFNRSKKSDVESDPSAYYKRTFYKNRYFNKKMYLWPVPQAQMDINPNLVQAPGYE